MAYNAQELNGLYGYQAIFKRYTTAHRLALTNIATGVIVFDIDLGKYFKWNGTDWEEYIVNTGSSDINLKANITYVDQTYGNDTTAESKNSSKPFETLTAAKNSITEGLIVVKPGEYTDFNLLKDNVSWYFMPGAIVNSPSNSDVAMFTTSNGESNVNTANVYGYGVFKDILGGRSMILDVNNPLSDIYFECQSAEVGYGDADVTINITDGKANVFVRDYIKSNSYDAIDVLGGELNLSANLIIATGSDEGNAIEVTGGNVIIKCKKYIAKGNFDVFGSSSAIAFSAGNAIIEGDGLSNLSDGLFVYNNSVGSLVIKGKLESPSSAGIRFGDDAAGKNIILHGMILKTNGVNSIVSNNPQTVISYNSFTNQNKAASITIKGTLTSENWVI